MTMTRTPLTGPVVWTGARNQELQALDPRHARVGRGRARCRARPCEEEGPRLVADHARGLPAQRPRRPAGRHRRRAGERRRHHEAARLPGGSLRRGRPAPDLLRPRHASRHAGVPEPQRRADARHPRRGRPCRPHLRRDQGPEGHHLPLLLRAHPDQRRPALPHRPHRRGGPPVRAPGAEGRRQHAGLDARHPQRDPRQASRPARRAVHRLLAQPLRRGRHRQGRVEHEPGHGLSAADLRRARRQVHLALFADLHRGGPARARRAQALGGAEGSHRRPDGDGAGALLRDDARARRPAADQQPRHLPRPHAVRGRRLERPRPPAAAGSGSPWPTTGRCRPVTRSCGAASRPASRAAASSRSRSDRQSSVVSR